MKIAFHNRRIQGVKTGIRGKITSEEGGGRREEGEKRLKVVGCRMEEEKGEGRREEGE